MTSEKKKMSLTAQIVIGMGAGALFGILLNVFADVPGIDEFLVSGVLHAVGAMFIASLQMMVVPLVFVSLVVGVTSMGNIASLGRMSIKALLLYLFTTAVAVTIALTLAVAASPGEGVEVSKEAAQLEIKEAPPATQLLIDMVPTNPVKAMAQGNMLQIIVFSMLFGVAVALAGEKGTHVVNLFDDLNEAIMHMVDIVMRLAPYGVFALIGKAFATQGLDLILPLIAYFLTFTVAVVVHGLGTYPLLVRVLGGLNPITFLRKMRDPATFAFSTASSAATIPITLRTLETKMGVKKSVASFTVPLGATINMDGTAIMQGVATVFIANVYGVDLAITDYLMVVLIATLASMGTAAVPGVGLVMLTMVLTQVGLPAEGVALIIGVDRLLDMMRTALNVTGDSAVAVIIARGEEALDEKVFKDLGAGSVVQATAGLGEIVRPSEEPA